MKNEIMVLNSKFILAVLLIVFILLSCQNNQSENQSAHSKDGKICEHLEQSIDLLRIRGEILDTLIHYHMNPEIPYNQGNLDKDISGNTLAFRSDIKNAKELIYQHRDCQEFKLIISIIEQNFIKLSKLWVGHENELSDLNLEIEIKELKELTHNVND